MRKYEGNDNYGKPKSDYLIKIANMDNEGLLKETEQMIWLSAYANNNSRSDYHWQCDACYDEWVKRDDVKSYERAWKRAANQ